MSMHRNYNRSLILALLLFAVAASGFVAAGVAKEGPSNAAAETAPATSLTDSAQPASGEDTASLRTAPEEWLGASGRLRAVIGTPASLDSRLRDGSAIAIREAAEIQPGLHDLGLVTPEGERFYIVSMLPYEAKEGKRLNGYYVGDWPQGRAGRYAPPEGFIEVTAENATTPISRSFTLRDFLTHDQQGVWPKFLVIQPRLLDKLELISAQLAARGLPSRIHVMSGFRTPQYNEKGVGKGGRASMSRHMYGDAADVFVDADSDGMMDDLNGDGKATLSDARVLASIAEDVERSNPDLVGGLSPYKANSAHGPFVHVDARGVKARW